MADPSRQVDTRPDSLARNFSAQLKGAFNLGGDLPTLSHVIEEKKHDIISQRHELHEIEAQLEATKDAIAEVNEEGISSSSIPEDTNKSIATDGLLDTAVDLPPVLGAQISTTQPATSTRPDTASYSIPSSTDQSLSSTQETTVPPTPDVPGQWQE